MRGVVLGVDGFEALRLCDAEGVDLDDAASRMNVSRPTLSRLLATARRTVARALADGLALRIDGGDYTLANSDDNEHTTETFVDGEGDRR